jgi:hypothetical protein
MNLVSPKCRFCGKKWSPKKGVVASQSYCPKCKNTHHKIVKEVFDLHLLTPDDFNGDYLLPNNIRKKNFTNE